MRPRARATACDLHWRRAPMFADARLRDWLLDDGSLTARLRARCADFSVRLLRQGRTRARHDEAALLGLHPREHAYGRDVLLHCGTVPVVYAHSVLSERARRGPWHAIGTMGTKPLGAALFADPRIARGALAFRRLEEGHPLYSAAARALGRGLPPLWARRSLFMLGGAPLLVTEAFLPAIAGLPMTRTGWT